MTGSHVRKLGLAWSCLVIGTGLILGSLMLRCAQADQDFTPVTCDATMVRVIGTVTNSFDPADGKRLGMNFIAVRPSWLRTHFTRRYATALSTWDQCGHLC